MKIKKVLHWSIGVFDKITAREARASIGDILAKRDLIEHNQFLATTRIMDIENYCDNDEKSFYYQNTISSKAYGNNHDERLGNDRFVNLIESYKKNGYDNNSLLVVDKDLRLLDGNHRLAMNYYTNNYDIVVKVLKRKSRNPNGIQWYRDVGLEEVFIQCVLDRYDAIQKELFDVGQVFCGLLYDKSMVKEISDISSRVVVDEISITQENLNWMNERINKYSYLIRFTPKNPCFSVKNGMVFSKTVERMVRKKPNVIMSHNCSEGQKMFELVKPYIKEC